MRWGWGGENEIGSNPAESSQCNSGLRDEVNKVSFCSTNDKVDPRRD